jgi:hypothetical protein
MDMSIDMGQHKIKDCENLFLENLINRIVILYALIGIIAVVFTEVRAHDLGRGLKDAIYLIAAALALGLALARRRLPTQFKALLILGISLVAGITGVVNYGFMGGAIFFLPLASVIIALFFSKQSVLINGLVYLFFLVAVAAGFISRTLEVNPGAEQLLTSHSHWIVYLISFFSFLVATCLTILRYRNEVHDLFQTLDRKNAELEKANLDLQAALDEIQTLKGILPLCSYCKKIRNCEGEWEPVDHYIDSHSQADVSHGICPDCLQEHFPEMD